jgi:hypothetical protein
MGHIERPKGAPDMKKKTTQHERAIDAFIAKKAKIDTILARLQKLSADHFELDPDKVDWGDVGTIAHVLEYLQEARDVIVELEQIARDFTALIVIETQDQAFNHA